jgi:hypothetical protein
MEKEQQLREAVEAELTAAKAKNIEVEWYHHLSPLVTTYHFLPLFCHHYRFLSTLVAYPHHPRPSTK